MKVDSVKFQVVLFVFQVFGAPYSPQSKCRPSLFLTGIRRKTRPSKRLSTSCHDRSTRESDGIHLQSLELTVLTREHADFFVFEAEGPLKGGHYRYRTAHTKDGSLNRPAPDKETARAPTRELEGTPS